jgi:hypothetical protein
MKGENDMVEQTEALIQKSDAVKEIRRACFHFADLYFHFSKVIIETLGYEAGKTLIEKAVRNRAVERGLKLRAEAAAQNLPLTLETWSQVTDIPFLGWDPSLGRLHCPYAAAWLERYAAEPWFPEIASLYCSINDPQVTAAFTGTLTQRIAKNVLDGDESCEREYFSLDYRSETDDYNHPQETTKERDT